jgi:hypothetical protein
MRNCEWITLVFFVFFVLVAWLKKLEGRQRWKISLIGLGGIGLCLLMAWSPVFLSVHKSDFLRNWLPVLLLMMVYWQAGLFIGQTHLNFQAVLEHYDRKILGVVFLSKIFRWSHLQLAHYFEFAYFLCYVLVPLGMGVLYGTGETRFSDFYWTNVGVSSYLCFVLIPFAQTFPPRMQDSDHGIPLHPNYLRKINLWILKHGSIQLNTVPSSHVASTFSAGLVLLQIHPVAGWLFLFFSLSIAAGAAVGRYHYFTDVLLALVLSGVVYLITV